MIPDVALAKLIRPRAFETSTGGSVCVRADHRPNPVPTRSRSLPRHEIGIHRWPCDYSCTTIYDLRGRLSRRSNGETEIVYGIIVRWYWLGFGNKRSEQVRFTVTYNRAERRFLTVSTSSGLRTCCNSYSISEISGIWVYFASFTVEIESSDLGNSILERAISFEFVNFELIT